MGGFLAVSTTIHGGVANPGIPFIDSPTGGIYETVNGGVGISLDANSFFEIDSLGFVFGYKTAPPFSMSGGASFAAGLFPYDVTVSPDSAYVYVANNNGSTVSVFSRNNITGALTEVVGSPFNLGANPRAVRVSPDNAFLYVVNYGLKQIGVYSRNSFTGALTAIAGSPYATGVQASGLAMSSDGKFVIVPDDSADTLSVFTRNASTGALAQVAGSPFATIGRTQKVSVSPDNLHVYATNFNDSKISAFSINQLTGALTPVAGSPFAAGPSPYSVAVSPDGYHVFVTNGNGASLSVYARDSITGVLTQIAGSPFAVGNSPYGVTVAPDGLHVFVVNEGANTLTVFTRDPVTGHLVQFAGSPFAIGAAPYGVTVSPDGGSIYTANAGGNNTSTYQLSNKPTYNLIEAFFDQNGQLSGSFNLNGSLRVYGETVLNRGIADTIYAKLAGLITQGFSAKSLTLDHATGGIVGTPTNDNAVAGMVGEYISAVVATPGVALATGVVSNVSSIVLTAGDWDVDGVVDFLPAATTSVAILIFGLSSVTGALGVQDTYGQLSNATEVPGANLIVQRTPTVRISVAVNTTIYLVAESVFTLNTLSAFGTIRARRVR